MDIKNMKKDNKVFFDLMLSRLKRRRDLPMKLELGKIKIDDIQFAEKTYVKDHVLYVNKEEGEKLVLEDDKLI